MCQGAMGRRKEPCPTGPPAVLVPRILNDCQRSQATHPRAIKQLVQCRKNSRDEFMEIWIRCLQPLFLVDKREPVVERMIKFVAAFTSYWDEEYEDDCEAFVEHFLGVLLGWVDAAHRAVRFRACQVISEVILRLPEDIPVADELWENITSSMQRRLHDKLTSVRVYAARALSRLVIADDIENDVTVTAYRKALASDHSAEVRKMVVMSMPAMTATVGDIVERTADISDSVRKAAYNVLGSKFRIQSLSIMQRAKILERGLAERVPGVRAECEELLRVMWLERDCNGDLLSLLRYLDVETHEKVCENVMLELVGKNPNLKASNSGGLRQFMNASGNEGDDHQLLDAEQALYWRMLCTYLHLEAEAKGMDAATTGGAQAVVKAAAAAYNNEFLESILPRTVADYVELVNAHLLGGPAQRFAARQLLLLAKLLDLTDGTSRRQAALLVQSLLSEGSFREEQGVESQNLQVVGDGLNLGGEESWANAVADLAQHVHASPGEFEGVLAAYLAESARPCREGGGDILQWLHCLAVTGLLLDNTHSLQQLVGQAVEPQEIHDSLLLPAVKHLHPEVQRAGVRCLGIFCGLELRPSSRAVEQLRLCLSSPYASVQKVALKALFDLILCHGATNLDRSVDMRSDGRGLPAQCTAPALQTPELIQMTSTGVQEGENRVIQLPLLELLAEFLDSKLMREDEGDLDFKTIIAAEGFAKLLLQNKRFSDIRLVQEGVVEKLVRLYFSERTQDSPRLRQCLSVFFCYFCSASPENKICMSRVFIPVMSKEWPGVYGNREKMGTVLAARKRATEIGRFLMHLLHLPPLVKESKRSRLDFWNDSDQGATIDDACAGPDVTDAPDEGHEQLAIRIFVEVQTFHPKKSMAGKTYIAMLCRFATSLQFRSSQQDAIKCLLQIVPHAIGFLPSGEKTLLKDIKEMILRLKAQDLSPDKGLTDGELRAFMERMGLVNYADEAAGPQSENTPPNESRATGRKRNSDPSRQVPATPTPIPTSTRALRKRPESLSTLTKRNVLKRSVKEKSVKKKPDSVSESESEISFSDSISTASSSDSDFELQPPSRVRSKAAANSIRPNISKQKSGTHTHSAGHVREESDHRELREDIAADSTLTGSSSQGHDGEDEASPRPTGRRMRYSGLETSRMRKLFIEQEKSPCQLNVDEHEAGQAKFQGHPLQDGSSLTNAGHAVTGSSDEAGSVCTSVSYQKEKADSQGSEKAGITTTSRRGKRSQQRKSNDSSRTSVSDGNGTSLTSEEKISTASKAGRIQQVTGRIKTTVDPNSIKSSINRDDTSSDFQPTPPRRRSQGR